jgi:hypothetical protein
MIILTEVSADAQLCKALAVPAFAEPATGILESAGREMTDSNGSTCWLLRKPENAPALQKTFALQETGHALQHSGAPMPRSSPEGKQCQPFSEGTTGTKMIKLPSQPSAK